MLKTGEYITFDDVLIEPKFSMISSRKDVDTSSRIGNLHLDLPIFAANMDTIFSIDLAIALDRAGGCAMVHRFWSIDENVAVCKQLLEQNCKVVASIGITENEYERAIALIENGVNFLCIDVAHGAQMSVVEQYNSIINKYKDNVDIIVGNFASGHSIQHFKELATKEPMAFKVGIGGGSACLTRVQTGCGVPQLSALLGCYELNPTANIISDGGHRTPGDVTKALAAGAKAVMLGRIFAATHEAPGEVIDGNYKIYRGSASLESYKIQGKEASWRTFEGDSFPVKVTGSVNDVMLNIGGGLRSAMTYVGAKNLQEFRDHSIFLKISSNSRVENGSHGKGA